MTYFLTSLNVPVLLHKPRQLTLQLENLLVPSIMKLEEEKFRWFLIVSTGKWALLNFGGMESGNHSGGKLSCSENMALTP